MPTIVKLPDDPTALSNKTLGDVVSSLLPYIYVFAGMGLLVMIIYGGIELMTAAGDPEKVKGGYGRISAGLIGFVIVFVSYMVVKIIETVLGVKIF